MSADIHTPRSDVIRRHVNNYFRVEKAATEESFGDDVKGIYHDRVSNPNDRVVHFHDGGDAGKMLVANAQLLFRIMKGTVKFPADIEEPVVLALPDPYKSDCLAELAERYGLLAAPIMSNEPKANICSMAELMKKAAKSIEALAPIIEDGVVDENDAPYIKKALTEFNHLQGELVGWQTKLTAALPDGAGVALKAVK